jgi:hypothetical protein
VHGEKGLPPGAWQVTLDAKRVPDAERLLSSVLDWAVGAPPAPAGREEGAMTAVPDPAHVPADGSAIGARAGKARGPVRGDPGRAARLIADAERTARSFTDEDAKASALAAVRTRWRPPTPPAHRPVDHR